MTLTLTLTLTLTRTRTRTRTLTLTLTRVAQTLTLHMAPPEGWLLRLLAVSDGVDTDNLQLRTLPEVRARVRA